MLELFQITLDESGDGWRDFARLLPPGEQNQAQRFHFDADRLRFAKCRALLRRELGSRLGAEPRDIGLSHGEHGKPFVDADTDLQFNVSHTRGLALLALSRGAEIGVDVEHVERGLDLDGVSRRVFTERERSGREELDEPAARRRFFALWTAKEAFLKATGRGLSLDPSLIEATLHQDGAITYACDSAGSSGLRGLVIDLPDPHAAALCAPAEWLVPAPLPPRTLE